MRNPSSLKIYCGIFRRLDADRLRIGLYNPQSEKMVRGLCEGQTEGYAGTRLGGLTNCRRKENDQR